MTIQNPTLEDLLTVLENQRPDSIVPLQPDGEPVPPHFHVTELARVQKDFIDCGGTVRRSLFAQLQLLVASDYDHRLSAEKLLKIIRSSAPLLGDAPLPLVLEHGDEIAVAYPVSELKLDGKTLTLRMESPSTACLAAETCGLEPEEARADAFRVPETASACCGPDSGCC